LHETMKYAILNQKFLSAQCVERNRMNPLSFVNVMQGTMSVPEFSCGNTLPLTAMPHGMNHFAIETRGQSHALFYHPTDRFTTGIRLTHMPSPWINDYGHFTFLAASGDTIGAEMGRACRSSFTPPRTLMTPHRISLNLQLFRTEMDLVPTERGALLTMTYPFGQTKRFVMTHFADDASVEVSKDGCSLVGYTTAHSWPTHENFRMYYVIRFDCPIDVERSVLRKGVGANLVLLSEKSRVTARIATSFLSMEQAERNLAREVAPYDREALMERAEKAWHDCLSLIEIEAEDEVMRTFYSCLYRMMLFPRIFHEYDEQGRPYHYSPDIGQGRPGVFYTDNGFWDTYKTVYPLYSLILPDLYREMCDGFCRFYEEAGWLPRWMSPGAVDCMPGTAIDAVFGDAAVKETVSDETLLRRMLRSTLHHAKNPSDQSAYGRDGLDGFLRLGWVTSDHKESVNKTQDYAYGNFCIARIAEKLGEREIADEMDRSSLAYRNLFDASTGFLRARDAQGEMRNDFSPIQWGGDYTEGSAWQNSFAMFHDFGGMTRLLGGRCAMEKMLDELFDTAPDYDVYGYGFEIHEMLEMAAVDFGQCALSNQPSFHIPYLYSMIGRPEKTQRIVRSMMSRLFSDGPCGFPGDEDNGSMAGWYVFSALGFYPVCPGTDQYVMGSPSVRRAVIHLGSGKELVIDVENQGENAVYLSSHSLGEREGCRLFVRQEELMRGGQWRMNMSESPVLREYPDEALPFSLTR